MARLLALLLIVQLLCAGVARSVDLHLSAAPAEAGQGHCTNCDDPPDHDSPGHKHIGECCFGGLLFGAPPAVQVQTGISAGVELPEFFDTSSRSWHSPVPQRPPQP